MTRTPVLTIRATTLPALCLAFGLIPTTGTFADQVIADDLIVKGDACVGFACVDGEIFDGTRFTVKVKASAPGLWLEDTSPPTGDYASTDWMIAGNETVQFGRNQLAFQDLTAGTVPFAVAGGAPDNSLFVAQNGRIGLGTTTPEADLHIVSINTPSVRLEQNTAGGQGAQSWDIASNSGVFYISDATTAFYTYPFTISSGAPTESLTINSDGDIGLGTGAPQAPLHMLRTNGTAGILVEDTGYNNGNLSMLQLTNWSGRARMQFTSVGNANQTGDWSISSGLTFVLQERKENKNVFIMDNAGNLAITGQLTTAGSCTVGCDRVFDADYDLPSIAEHQARMWDKGYLPNVGPTAEDAPFNVSDKMGRMLNELEHAHIFIGQQERRIEAQDSRIATQDNRIAALEAKLEALLAK